MSNQRPGKKKAMTLHDHDDKISIMSLIRFCDEAVKQLNDSNDKDAALRFEIFREYLVQEFRGGYLKYTHKALGL